jgi:hypothetical protein
LTYTILLRHAILRPEIVSDELRDAYNGCVSSYDKQDAVK